MEEIEAARRRCLRVMDRIGQLPGRTNITDSCRRTLLKMAHSELRFLSRVGSDFNSHPNHMPLSVNIGHLETVVYLLEQPFVSGVSRVCKAIPLSPATGKDGYMSESSIKIVHVDIVCTLNKKPVWIIVSDRKPKYVYWHGNHKSKGFQSRIEQVLAAGRSSQIMKPLSIILFFSHGIGNFVYEKLRDEFGASELNLEFSFFDCNFCEESDSEWINVLARSYQKACILEIKVDTTRSAVSCSECVVKNPVLDSPGLELQEYHTELNLDDTFVSLISEIKLWSTKVESVDFAKQGNLIGDDDLINFDTTALIALVSGISNGSAEKLLATPETELRQRFKGNFEFVIAQIMSEIHSPMHAELACVISGKRGIICESVLLEFKQLVSICGGPCEKLRADKILQRLMIVLDSPSDRMMSLPTTRKLASKNKVVFGTGDRWHAPTLTANMAFVRAVSQIGMSLFTIAHRPRALTGD